MNSFENDGIESKFLLNSELPVQFDDGQ